MLEDENVTKHISDGASFFPASRIATILFIACLLHCGTDNAAQLHRLDTPFPNSVQTNPLLPLVAAVTGRERPGDRFVLTLFDEQGRPQISRFLGRAIPVSLQWAEKGRTIYYIDEERRLMIFELDEKSMLLRLQVDQVLNSEFEVFGLITNSNEPFIVAGGTGSLFPANREWNVYAIQKNWHASMSLAPLLSSPVSQPGAVRESIQYSNNRKQWLILSLSCASVIDLESRTHVPLHCRQPGEPFLVTGVRSHKGFLIARSDGSVITVRLEAQGEKIRPTLDLPAVPDYIQSTAGGLYWARKNATTVYFPSWEGETQPVPEKLNAGPVAMLIVSNRIAVFTVDCSLQLIEKVE